MKLSYTKEAVLNYAKVNNLMKPSVGIGIASNKRGKRDLVDNRFYLMTILRFGFSMSTTDIARRFGLKGHASVTNATTQALLNWDRKEFRKNNEKLSQVFPFYIEDPNLLLKSKPVYKYKSIVLQLSATDVKVLEERRRKFGDQSIEDTAKRLLKMLL